MTGLAAFAFAPFADYAFMRRALAACMALSISGAPLGIFLAMRRMTLFGDALSHAILPGVALAFLASGLALLPMTLGGLIAGLGVAALSGAISRLTPLKEDASFTGTYLIALAAGVALVTLKGNSVDLMHILFGNVLAVDNASLMLVTAAAGASLLALAAVYRGLIVECADPVFLRSVGGHGGMLHQLFLGLVVLNLVAAFQALGTLMALGLMLLPAISARLWTNSIDRMMPLAMAFAVVSSYAGLLASYYLNLPSGPAIVLAAGAIYAVSVLRRVLPLRYAVFLLLLFGAAPGVHAAPLNVVASFSILGDMVREVGGKDISLSVLVGPDEDAHVFSPAPRAAILIASADLVIINGLGFEGWMDRLISASGYRRKVVTASSGAKLIFENGAPDPHAWQSLENAQIYVTNIRDALSAADPAHSADYQANAASYSRKLAALDAWVKSEIASVPPTKRYAITPHGAFGYFAEAYGVTFLSPQGISTESEVSAAGMARLVDQIRREHITALFMENITNPRLISELQRETGARIGGKLYSDALSRPGGSAATYLAMFRHNVSLLVAAMKGNPT